MATKDEIHDAECELAWAKNGLLAAAAKRDEAVRDFKNAEDRYAAAAERLGRLAHAGATDKAEGQNERISRAGPGHRRY